MPERRYQARLEPTALSVLIVISVFSSLTWKSSSQVVDLLAGRSGWLAADLMQMPLPWVTRRPLV